MNVAFRFRERRLEAARGYLMLDLPEQALRELRQVSEHCIDWHALNGDALRTLCRFEEALASFEAALDEMPEQIQLLMGAAWCLKRLNRLPEAIECMQTACRANPDEPIALYNLACYYALAGDKSQSLSWLGRALRMKGDLTSLIAKESDFDGLRKDPDFLRLIDLAQRPQEKENA